MAGGLLNSPSAHDAPRTSYATLTFQVQDDGGVVNGGVDVDQSANTLTIDVTSVNDARDDADHKVTTHDDTAYSCTTADFGFSDASDTPANALLAVKITFLPSGCGVSVNCVFVFAGHSL